MKNIIRMAAEQKSYNYLESSEILAADSYINLQDNIVIYLEITKMKTTSPSFILELPLKTNPVQESTILVRLNAGRQLYNACLGESLTRLDLLRQSKEFQQIKTLPKGKARTQAYNDLNKKFEFTQYSLHNYAAEIRQDWIRDHIGIHIAQKLVARAFKAVQKIAFKKAKHVRFKGKNQLDTLEGQNNVTGLIFEDKVLSWSGLKIPCIVDEKNEHISYGLQHRVKYCRLVRRKINSKNRFYIQLILEGIPYQNPDHKIGNEEIGLDVGPSTIAIVGDTKAELKQFCSEIVPKQKQKKMLQRKLDRSRRATNPDNYNENGTVKKGKKGSKKWIKSNRYKATNNELAETDRKLAAHRKSLHGRDINEIIAMGTTIKTEKISYKAWQKLYGKSVLMRAPSMFMSSLKRKAENAGGSFEEIPTRTTRLSQMCHICEEAVKKPLSQRWHTCCGIEMQRDLYSAFLSKCVVNNSLDIARAKQLWPGLEPVLSEAVSRAYQSANGRILPASFGFGSQRQSRSLVKLEETTIETVDAVLRDTFYEEESRREVV